MQDLSPIKAHQSPQKSASEHRSGSPKKRTSSVHWSSDSSDSDDYLELDKRKQRTEEERAQTRKQKEKNNKTNDRSLKKGQKSGEENPKLATQLSEEGKQQKEK
jgi:hypothetical protein